eukprot:tig00000640_g2770.t1
MREAVRAKFSQDAALRDRLLGTGRRRLVERTGADGYWGDGGDGSGHNRLGEVLMELRDELAAAAPAAAAASASAAVRDPRARTPAPAAAAAPASARGRSLGAHGAWRNVRGSEDLSPS